MLELDGLVYLNGFVEAKDCQNLVYLASLWLWFINLASKHHFLNLSHPFTFHNKEVAAHFFHQIYNLHTFLPNILSV